MHTTRREFKMTYTVTGTVFEPKTFRSQFDHDESTEPTKLHDFERSIPSKPRKISIDTTSKSRAEDIADTFRQKGRDGTPLFVDVTVEEKA